MIRKGGCQNGSTLSSTPPPHHGLLSGTGHAAHTWRTYSGERIGEILGEPAEYGKMATIVIDLLI
jgi:hypothetical protein